MHPSAYAWACSALTEQDVAGRHVVEAGSQDVNGSVRPHVLKLGPASYTGTDLFPGEGVDRVADAADLGAVFGEGFAGVVICTEMLEHAKDWQAAMRGLISVLAKDGILVLTTRSAGFPFHGYPHDYWRYPVEGMGIILRAAGLLVERLEADIPSDPGVFARARKPQNWSVPVANVLAVWDAAGVTPV